MFTKWVAVRPNACLSHYQSVTQTRNAFMKACSKDSYLQHIHPGRAIVILSRGGCRPPGPPRKKAFGPTKKAPKIDPKIVQKIDQKINQKSDQKLEAKSAAFGGAPLGILASNFWSDFWSIFWSIF